MLCARRIGRNAAATETTERTRAFQRHGNIACFATVDCLPPYSSTYFAWFVAIVGLLESLVICAALFVILCHPNRLQAAVRAYGGGVNVNDDGD